MVEQLHWIARNQRTYGELFGATQGQLPREVGGGSQWGLQDDNGPPCFDTLADAERLAAKKGIIESADLLNLPDCENPVINHENLAVYAIKVGEH